MTDEFSPRCPGLSHVPPYKGVGQWDKDGLERDTERDREKPNSIKTIAKQRLDRLKNWDSQWDGSGTGEKNGGTERGTTILTADFAKEFIRYIEEQAEKLSAAAALEDWSHHFEERAGIIEEGDQVPRKEAELMAFLGILYEYLSMHYPIIMEQLAPLIAYAHGRVTEDLSHSI